MLNVFPRVFASFRLTACFLRSPSSLLAFAASEDIFEISVSGWAD